MPDRAGQGGTPYERDADRISVRVRGLELQGWLQSEVGRSLEAIAGTFSVPVSLTPGEPPPIKRQDPVQVLIGGQVVITGHVLAAEPFYRRGDCGMRIAGRDLTGDLVRCSAVHQGGQWRSAKLDQIVRDLLKPFGMTALVETDIGGPIQDFKLGFGESVLDAVARAARLRGVLVTRDNLGHLLLTRAGKKRFKGSIRRGWNVISMDGIGTDEERHSEYTAYGQAGVMRGGFNASHGLHAKAVDPELKALGRYLPLMMGGSGNTTKAELQTLVDHTVRVRRGHSLGFKYVVEGWTFEGEPWPLNERVAIYDDVAGLDGAEWLISSVRNSCDIKEGPTTELLVHPVEAYDTAPLKSKPTRRNWGKRGDAGKERRGPVDRAKG